MAAVQQEAAQMPPQPPANVVGPGPSPSAPAAQETASGGSEEELSSDPEIRLQQVAEKLAKRFPNAPHIDVLRQWKALHGDIFLLPIDDKVYIYRYLKRQEWAQMQANPELEGLRNDQQEDILFHKCLLWPPMPPEAIAAMPAGGITMLVEQIRIQSLFLDPLQVASLTLKL
jgi:hypothetical protein